jgi:hypothetical protein
MGRVALWLVLAMLAARPLFASGHSATGYDSSALFAAGAALPSETGALLDGRAAHFVVGWSWQVPVTATFRHRVVSGFNWIPGGDDHRWEGRLGYRFGSRNFFLGAGASLEHAGVTWSPEVGVRLLPGLHGDPQLDPAAHVMVRAEVAPAFDALRGVTILLGWTAF